MSDSRSGKTPEATAASEDSGPAIRVAHLWHTFGGFPVLRDVSFEVAHGEIFGFIGPNGAGKTTTIRILATLLEPMAGRVDVEGVDVSLDPEAVRRVIGYMPDHSGVYERITIREYLEFFAAACRVDRDVVHAVLELTDLVPIQDRLVVSLSKGMRQRLQLARVLLHDPKVLILDEPASDLDPRARIEMRDLLLELKELGKTIFLSSHILSELSDICSSVGIIEKGELLAAGPIGALAEQLGARRAAANDTLKQPSPAEEDGGASPSRDLDVPNVPPAQTPGGTRVPDSTRRRVKLRVLGDSAAAARLIPSGGPVLAVQPAAGGWLIVHFQGEDRFVADLVRHLVNNGVLIVAVEPERNELERIFLEVTKGNLQ